MMLGKIDILSMKYKLKFEIVYPNLDKETIREMKLETIMSSSIPNTEITSDSPINPPNREDIVVLGDADYSIFGIRHKLEDNLYTIIVEVENKKIREMAEEKIKRDQMQAMLSRQYKTINFK